LPRTTWLRDKAKTLVENLENGVKIDSKPDTSIVQQRRAGFRSFRDRHCALGRRWSLLALVGRRRRSDFVCAARALLAIDPQNKLIEPVTNWLVKNRRGAQWSNTRDTAIVVLTLNDYLRSQQRTATANVGYELLVNGNSVATNRSRGGCAERAQQV
jgi:hypothetical protein